MNKPFGKRSLGKGDYRSLSDAEQWTGEPEQTLVQRVRNGEIKTNTAPSTPISNAIFRASQWLRKNGF